MSRASNQAERRCWLH